MDELTKEELKMLLKIVKSARTEISVLCGRFAGFLNIDSIALHCSKLELIKDKLENIINKE